MQILPVLSLASLALAAPSIRGRAEAAALLRPQGANVKPLPNKYIVKMRDSAEVSTASTKYNADRTYSHAIKGFAATLQAEQLEAIRNDPNVSALAHQKISRVKVC